MVPIYRILSADYTPGHLVCRSPPRTWAELEKEVAGIFSQLPDRPQKPWLLALDSTYLFAAALLACWQKGVTPLVAPDTQPGTLAKLRPGLAGIVSDRKLQGAGLPVLRPSQADHHPAWIERAPRDTALTLFTSGSTGQRKRIDKSFAQLANEVQILHEQWGESLRGRPRWATVSHQHIYGFLFALAWPLCTGDPFPERSRFFWEELLPDLSRGPAVIIASPTHLRHLPDVSLPPGLDARRVRIFSSGGPLSRTAALRIAAAWGEAPIEVLGSTETGGIAFRQQSEGPDTPWQALPRVSIRIQHGLLEVRSPLLPDPEAWTATGDQADAEARGRFHLRARADRIIKLAEKRFSLAEMEERLLGHEHVADARYALLRPGSGDDRPRLAAAVAVSESGREALTAAGEKQLIHELREHLLVDFEAIALPRVWRFLDELPYNSQGKMTQDMMMSLFGDAKSGVG